jgi:hypothetical protein
MPQQLARVPHKSPRWCGGLDRRWRLLIEVLLQDAFHGRITHRVEAECARTGAFEPLIAIPLAQLEQAQRHAPSVNHPIAEQAIYDLPGGRADVAGRGLTRALV